MIGGGGVELRNATGLIPIATSKVKKVGTTGSGHQAYRLRAQELTPWADYSLTNISGWSSTNVPGFEQLPNTMQRAVPAETNAPPGVWRNKKTLADIISEIRDPQGGWIKRYIDPIYGSDNNSGANRFDPADPLSLTGPLKSLATGVTPMNPYAVASKICLITTDGAFFRLNSNGADPWSKLEQAHPKVRSFAVINQSAYDGDPNPALGWTSSMEIIPSTTWSLKSGSTTVWQVDIPALSAGTVPTFSWSSEAAGQTLATRISGGVWDDSDLDEYGAPRRYVCSNGTSDNDTRPFSYWYDNTLRRFYVNTGSATVRSTESLRLFANRVNGYLEREADGTGATDRQVILVNGTFEGGTNPLRTNDSLNNATRKLNITAYGCSFTRSRSRFQGLSVETPGHIELLNCTSCWNGNDGVSYYPKKLGNYDDSLVLTFVESQCRWFLNGFPNWITVDNPYTTNPVSKSNGSTCHNACSGIRVGVVAYWNGGPNIGDAAVNGYARVLNLGSWFYDSLGLGDAVDYQSDYALSGSNSSGGTPERQGAIGWLIDCPIAAPGAIPTGSQYVILIDKGGAVTSDERALLFRNGPAPSPLVRFRGGATVGDSYNDITNSYS